ncbi:hypothetical protein ACR79T_09200 [Sphingobacterium spiritivorum]
MKKILLIMSLLTTSFMCIGQGQKYTFIEAGGSSTIVALNFDMRFNKDSREGLGLRAGVGNTFGLFDSEAIKDIVVFPIGLNYIYGKKRSALVFGINTSIALINDKKGGESSFIIAPEVGYRFRPLERGFAFHASYSPLFNTVDGAMPFWFGIGLGYSWK